MRRVTVILTAAARATTQSAPSIVLICCNTHIASHLTSAAVYSLPLLLSALALGCCITELQDLLPGIINELGQENLDQLKEIAGNFPGGEAGAADDDDDVPDLVENFEEASK